MTAARWALLAVASACLFLVSAVAASVRGVFPIERELSLWARDVPPDLFTVFQWMSRVGEGVVLLPLGILVFLLLERRLRVRWPLWGLALIAGAAVEKLTKWVVARPRPSGFALGFPSGHTAAAAAFFLLTGYFAQRALRGRPARLVAWAASAAIVLMVGAARVVLHAHWPMDVVGGAALGMACAATAVWWFERGEDPAWLGDAERARDALRRRLRATRWQAAAVAAAAAVLIGIDLGARTLATNDDVRFALLARDILRHGDVLFPTLNGVTYFNKPVLLAWLVALASWPVHQVTQLTAVLPSAAAGVATVLLVLALGQELLGPRAGIYAALVALASQGLLLHARLPLPDMLLTLTAAASVWALARALRGAPGPWWLAFYGFLAAGFWTKGIPGLLPLAVALLHAIPARRSGALARLRLPLGVPLLAVAVCTWWALGLVRSASGMGQSIVTDQVLWYRPNLTPAAIKNVIDNVLGIVFPWVIVLPVAVYQALRAARRGDRSRQGLQLVLLWVATTFALVALSTQQRFRYYLPLVPSASLLIGWWFAAAPPPGAGSPRRVPAGWWASGAALVGVVVGLWSAFRGPWPVDYEIAIPASALEATVVLGALVAALTASTYAAARRRSPVVFAVAWVAAALALTAGHHWQVRRHNAAFDYPGLHARLRPALDDVDLRGVWGMPVLPAVYYFDRELRYVGSESQLEQALDAPGAAVLITESALRRRGRRSDLSPREGDVWGGDAVWLVQRGPSAAAGALETAFLAAALRARPTEGEAWRLFGARLVTAMRERRYPLREGGLADRGWEIACVAVALGGLLLRRFAQRRPGLPGRELASLAGTTLAVLGLALFTRMWLPPIIVLVAATVYGVAGRLAAGAAHPIAAGPRRRRRTAYAVAIILIVPMALDVVEDFLESENLVIDTMWTAVAVLGLALLVVTWLRSGTQPATKASSLRQP